MALLVVQCLLLALPCSVSASSAFLHRSAQSLSVEQKSAVLAAIEGALGEKHRQATEVRLAPLEKLLAPTLNALPKNEHGRFGHKAARYALHRLFVQRHAWFVKGVGLDHDVSSNSTAASILQDGVPDLIQNMFEERLGSHGLDAHEVAVMAATFENLAHAEAMDRVRLAYSVHGIRHDSTSLTKAQVESVVDVYMAAYITSTNLTAAIESNLGPAGVLANAEELYPGWAAVRTFVRELMWVSTSGRSTFSSVDVSHFVTSIGDKFGRWQSHECDDLKRDLLSITDDGTGRVPLAKFYDSALNHGQWQFTEKIEYLRMLGALDESRPSSPSVIVPNYVLSPSNCVASSAYYSVCCLDECEDMMDHLEQEIKAPDAKPALIASHIAAMPSSTPPANRIITTQLLERLEEIAVANDGLVPLHGRLFAQWLHHLSPRECPFPHLSGTTQAVRPEEIDEDQLTASPEEMQQYIDAHAGAEYHNNILWSHADELYVERAPPPASSWLRSLLRVVAFLAAASLTASFFLRVGRKAEEEIYGFSKQCV